jgi:DNA repair exonuclease SbcCD nuclease subunit
MSKTDSDLAFNAKVQDLLGIFKVREEGDDRPLILFGHLDVAGTRVNGNYIVESDGYSFNQGMLEATGADVITLGHIHKRDGYYAGALYQQSFGDEGNPQGFEIYTINRDGKIEQEYVEIDLRPFETVEIHDIPDIPQFVHSEMRLRFHSDEAYVYANSILDMSRSTVEICFNKRNHVARSEMELTSMMSDEELLLTYMTLNPIPDSITDEDIRKVLMI